MNKLPCEVVRDLLPSYVDGLTSETTNRLVDGHIEDCAPCRAALRAIRAPETEPSAVDDGAEKEIDFLKKNKSKNRAVLLWSLAAAVFVVAAVLLTRAFVIGETLSEHVALCDVQVNGNLLSVELLSADSARVVKGISFSESNGVVTLSARSVLVGLRRKDGGRVEFTAEQPIRQVRIGERIFWDDGADISRQVSNLYLTRHDYIGDMPANDRTANALGISRYLGAYQNELLTAQRPYVWKLLLQENVPESRRELREREMEAFACVLLALVGNLDEVRYEYTVDGAAAEKAVTAAAATALLGQNIKDCCDSPRLLQELMRKTGLYNYDFADMEYMADVIQSVEEGVTWIEMVNMTDDEVISLSVSTYSDGALCVTQGGQHADNSPIKKGQSMSFGLNSMDFGGKGCEDTELTLKFSLETADGAQHEVDGALRLAPTFGGELRVLFTGSAAEGYRIGQ